MGKILRNITFGMYAVCMNSTQNLKEFNVKDLSLIPKLSLIFLKCENHQKPWLYLFRAISDMGY